MAGEGVAVDPAKVIAHLRQRHAQQLDEATYENAQLQAAVETVQAENETLRARTEELGRKLAAATNND